jgi:hypothetical protein
MHLIEKLNAARSFRSAAGFALKYRYWARGQYGVACLGASITYDEMAQFLSIGRHGKDQRSQELVAVDIVACVPC